MRVAKVTGKITLSSKLNEVAAGSLLLVRPCNRKTLVGKDEGNDETIVMYDNLGSREGDLVGLVEGREATAPFWPGKVPFDAYNACILDELNFRPILEVD